MINCRDGCGAETTDDGGSFTFLAIAGGWRCGACVRKLLETSALVGVDGETTDKLDPKSRGALPKETASTISPPSRI